MKIIKQDGDLIITCKFKELEYILSNRIKANNTEDKLPYREIERISKETINYIKENNFFNSTSEDKKEVTFITSYEGLINALYEDSKKFI